MEFTANSGIFGLISACTQVELYDKFFSVILSQKNSPEGLLAIEDLQVTCNDACVDTDPSKWTMIIFYATPESFNKSSIEHIAKFATCKSMKYFIENIALSNKLVILKADWVTVKLHFMGELSDEWIDYVNKELDGP